MANKQQEINQARNDLLARANQGNELTKAEASSLFGTNFTGVKMIGPDRFTPDASALNRISQFALPSTGEIDLSQFVGDDISTSTDTEAQIRANIEKQQAASRSAIGADFEGRIGSERELGVKRKGGTQAQLGVSKGLGLSSAEIQLIRQEEEFTAKRIGDLEKSKQIALANVDFAALGKINESLRKEEERADKLAEARFNRITKIIGIEQGERSLDLQESQITAGIENQKFQRTIAAAGLTGIFEGADTVQAKQLALQNALANSEVTGKFKGEDTIQFRKFQSDLGQLEFQNQIDLLEVQASLPTGFQTAIKLPDGTSYTLNGMKKPTGSGGPTSLQVFNATLSALKLQNEMPSGTEITIDGLDGEPLTLVGTSEEKITQLEERGQKYDNVRDLYGANVEGGKIITDAASLFSTAKRLTGLTDGEIGDIFKSEAQNTDSVDAYNNILAQEKEKFGEGGVAKWWKIWKK